jgi:glycosyltransferase involved in cell wall biosynthesis
MIEAMACGTPVVACRKGSVPELVEDGVTGRIVNNLKEAVKAVQEIGTISRRGCYEAFQRRFTSARMARDYVHLFRQLLKLDLAA